VEYRTSRFIETLLDEKLKHTFGKPVRLQELHLLNPTNSVNQGNMSRRAKTLFHCFFWGQPFYQLAVENHSLLRWVCRVRCFSGDDFLSFQSCSQFWRKLQPTFEKSNEWQEWCTSLEPSYSSCLFSVYISDQAWTGRRTVALLCTHHHSIEHAPFMKTKWTLSYRLVYDPSRRGF
jgi:hypothetical protein